MKSVTLFFRFYFGRFCVQTSYYHHAFCLRQFYLLSLCFEFNLITCFVEVASLHSTTNDSCILCACVSNCFLIFGVDLVLEALCMFW